MDWGALGRCEDRDCSIADFQFTRGSGSWSGVPWTVALVPFLYEVSKWALVGKSIPI